MIGRKINCHGRDNLIYMFARSAIEKQREEEHADEEAYWTPTQEEWTEFYAAAADVVDAIPPDKRVQRTHDEEARLERVREERVAATDREETAELAAGVVAAYFSMFGIFDGLFLLLAVTALLASIGAAGIPYAGTVMMVVVLGAVGLPVDYVGIILAVDRILDMYRTSVNVWSDSTACAVIARMEGSPPVEPEVEPSPT